MGGSRFQLLPPKAPDAAQAASTSLGILLMDAHQMGADRRARGLHSLSSELFELLLKDITDRDDRRSLFCTCTATRDAMLGALGLPHGPQLTHDLHTSAAALRGKSYGQLCMQLWLREGPRLQRACNTAARAAGRAQLCIGRHEEAGPTRHAASCAQLTQLMAVGTWQGLTVIHLKGISVEQLVPGVLARHCPNLHSLHLVSTCRLLGLGVPSDMWEHALSEQRNMWSHAASTAESNKKGNRDYNLQQHILSCPSRTILNFLHPTPCPQLHHLDLNVRSAWPDVWQLYANDQSTYKNVVRKMGNLWKKLEAAPRIITQLKLRQLVSTSEQEQHATRLLAGGIQAAKAAWEAAHHEEVDHLTAAIAGVNGAKQDLDDRCKRQFVGGQRGVLQVGLDLDAVCRTTPPSLDVRGYSTWAPIDGLLEQVPLLQSRSFVQQWRSLETQRGNLQQQLDTARKKHEQQQRWLSEWWHLHSQLVRCHDNEQYARQLHQDLQSQVQQQLAALPNLSSLHIQQGRDLPPGLTEAVLQLGTQLTTLKVGTAGNLNKEQANSPAGQRQSQVLVMPQQLSSVCTQLTNLQQLQWDDVVDDEGMRHLLKLPHLQHVTFMTNLSQSFAGAQCSWQSLTTMHSEPSKSNSTCKQLAYLPLASLRQPVKVVRNSEIDSSCNSQPQLFAFTEDPAADLAIVKQACSNVARCGGLVWAYKPWDCEKDTPCIVFKPHDPKGCNSYPTPPTNPNSSSNPNPTLQQLQVLEASLPLLQGPIMEWVAIQCQPLNDAVLSLLLPHLATWGGVDALDLRHSIIPDNIQYKLLGILPPSITHLYVNFAFKRSERSLAWCLSESCLMTICEGATRPITIHLKRVKNKGYNEADWDSLSWMKTDYPLVKLVPVGLKPVKPKNWW